MQKQRWVEEADRVMPNPTKMDSKTEQKATDYIEKVKAQELQTSRKARDWEAGRKKEWQINKKAAMLARNPKPQDPARKLINELKSGGEYDTYIRPTFGYLAITVDEPVEETSSGLFVLKTEDTMPNTGTVNAIGERIVYGERLFHDPPAKVGDRILFRKGAGMNVALKGKDYLFLHFQDVIGVFDPEAEA